MKAQVVRHRLGSLKAHPQQDVLFPQLGDVELHALAENIKQNGLKYPIEILPNQTIVCGHQRVAAAKLLGWTEIDCVVRDDLAAAGDAAVEEHLIADNLNRRQLTELDVARLVRRLRGQRAGKRTANGCGSWRDEIAKRFGVSGRTVTRWERVLDADERVQVALSRKQIKLSQAIKIAGMSKKEQQRIGSGLAAGRSLRELLPTRVAQSRAAAKQPDESAEALVRRLQRLVQQLEAVPLPMAVSAEERLSLNTARDALWRMLDHLDDLDREPAPGSGEWLPLPSRGSRKAKRPRNSRVRTTQDNLS